MKYIQMFESFMFFNSKMGDSDLENEGGIEKFLRKVVKGSYTKNSQGKIDVEGSVDMHGYNVSKIPVNFGKVSGDFLCYDCDKLTNLEGSPEEVGGNFSCSLCKSLTSLKGAPRKVGGYFACGYCASLASLKGSPDRVEGDFACGYCPSLVTLEGSPAYVGGDFYFKGCEALHTLSGAKSSIAKDIEAGEGESLPPEEKTLIGDTELLRLFLSSGLTLKDFLFKKRGTIKGREFGF